jgi:trans-aconitate methyltransferase
MNYYDQNSQEFIDSTLNLDMSEFYTRFECYLGHGDRLLDIGCGPGRDLKYFAKNYRAEGLEPSKVLAEHAHHYAKCPVHQQSIQEYQTSQKYRGLWACASLLHIPSSELPTTFQKLATLLTNDGALYLSFKHGTFEGERGGRLFTDMTEDSLKEVLKETPLKIEEIWLTSDIRAGREDEKWLNAVLKNNFK